MPSSSSADAQHNLAEIQARLAAAYLQEGRYALALDKAEQAIAADARYAPAYSTLALIRIALGQDDLAGAAYTQALRYAPEDPELQNAYGVYLCRRGEYVAAETAFLRAIQDPLYVTPAMALTNAGICASRSGARDEAMRYLQQALQRDPQSMRAAAALNTVLGRSDQPQETKLEVSH
ncbi:MAG: tetratricopeptide repeat protein [Gammaproteobacteria bacterium]